MDSSVKKEIETKVPEKKEVIIEKKEVVIETPSRDDTHSKVHSDNDR